MHVPIAALALLILIVRQALNCVVEMHTQNLLNAHQPAQYAPKYRQSIHLYHHIPHRHLLLSHHLRNDPTTRVLWLKAPHVSAYIQLIHLHFTRLFSHALPIHTTDAPLMDTQTHSLSVTLLPHSVQFHSAVDATLILSQSFENAHDLPPDQWNPVKYQ